MIYVSQDQLDQVEYLITQSTQGHHVLFDPEIVRQIFLKNPSCNLEPKIGQKQSDQEAEKHIENIILQPTLSHKKAYLEKLDSETFERVVRTYFNIVENNIFEKQEIRH